MIEQRRSYSDCLHVITSLPCYGWRSPLFYFFPWLTIQRTTVKGTKKGRKREEPPRQATFRLKVKKEKTLCFELLVFKLHSPATISLKYVPVQITTFIYPFLGRCLLNFPLCASVQKRGISYTLLIQHHQLGQHFIVVTTGNAFRDLFHPLPCQIFLFKLINHSM